MDISIYNNPYPTEASKIAVFNSYSSLIWCERYNEIGALDLEIDATEENIKTFQKGFCITRDDDDSFFVITQLAIETKDNNLKLIIGAVESKNYLTQRIILDYISVTDKTLKEYLEKLMLNITTAEERKFPFTIHYDSDFDSVLVTDKVRFDNLGEKLIELAKTYGFGWKLTKDLELIFYFGENKSETVIFSPEYDNISTTKYEMDSANYKNVCYVTGSGEDYEKLYSVAHKGKEVATAFKRYETSVDNDNDEDGSINIGAGTKELAQNETTTKFEAKVIDNSFRYKEDYNLGDIVTIQNELGIIVSAQIIEIIETWDNEGYTLEPVFHYINLSDDNDLVTEEMFAKSINTENNTELEVEE